MARHFIRTHCECIQPKVSSDIFSLQCRQLDLVMVPYQRLEREDAGRAEKLDVIIVMGHEEHRRIPGPGEQQPRREPAALRIEGTEGLVKEDGKPATTGETLEFKVVELRRSTRRILLSHLRTYAEVKEKAAAVEAENTKKAVKRVNANVEKATLGDLDVLASLKEKLEKGE